MTIYRTSYIWKTIFYLNKFISQTNVTTGSDFLLLMHLGWRTCVSFSPSFPTSTLLISCWHSTQFPKFSMTVCKFKYTALFSAESWEIWSGYSHLKGSALYSVSEAQHPTGVLDCLPTCTQAYLPHLVM